MLRLRSAAAEAAADATPDRTDVRWPKARSLITTVIGAIRDARQMRTDAYHRYPHMDR